MNYDVVNESLLKEGYVLLNASFAKFVLGNLPHLKIFRRI